MIFWDTICLVAVCIACIFICHCSSPHVQALALWIALMGSLISSMRKAVSVLYHVYVILARLTKS
ncbi:hypothetical protein C8R44DRAFT_861949, partial [Mycena epipterygia]